MAIKFNGVDNLLQKLEKVGGPDLEAAMEKACLIVEAAAKQNAPKDTGALRNSIESRIETKEGEIQGIVFTPLEYAPYVEYGTGLFAENGGRKNVPWVYQNDKGEWCSTKGQQPHPYMRPALNSNREKIKEILGESIKND